MSKITCKLNMDEWPDMVYEETDESIVNRIWEEFGFAPAQITLLEGSFTTTTFEYEGQVFGKCRYCDHMAFSVKGRGYSTVDGFTDIVRDHAYDN